MIWIALHLPLLSLETFAALASDGVSSAQPLALLEGQRIAHVNAAARSLGIEPGQKRGSALALAPGLRLGQADPARDAEALQAVAHAALAFTPSVSIPPPGEGVKIGATGSGAIKSDATRSSATRSGATPSAVTKSGATLGGGTKSDATKRDVTNSGGANSGGRSSGGTSSGGTSSGGSKTGATTSGATTSGGTRSGGTQSSRTSSGETKSGAVKADRATPRGEKISGAARSGATPSGATVNAGADTVLLEVQPSLRYFGGLAVLKARLHRELAPLGHCLHTVVAPTALGAALLARIHSDLDCADLARLHMALDAAPVWLLGPGRTHWEALQGMGLRTLADLRVLPRAGLAQRFGVAVLDEVDRAYGRRPDPREPLSLPAVFESRLELFARADTTEQVLQGAGLLLSRLVAWLSAQHAQARRFTLVMAHEPRWRASQTPVATPLEIALAEPSRDAAHLLALLGERLAQVELQAPTLELRLHCTDIARRPPPNAELFPTPRTEGEGLTRLIERLQARLGPEQVQRLRELEDHRPEHATESSMADARRPSQRHRRPCASPKPRTAPVRPVWLLSEVQPLRERESGPCLDGQPLRLLSGPERIECGWWDEGLAERDYYIAQAPDGALVWIYRSRVLLSVEAKGWFLQGQFG